MVQSSVRILTGLAAVVVVCLISLPGAEAGTIGLSWDSSPGATGYRVYYGPAENQWINSFPVFGTTTTTVNGLGDCANWHFAVSATNAAGESGLSSAVSSWPRPSGNPNPSSARQGTQFGLTISGANFQQGASLEIDNPNVILEAIQVVNCNSITANVTVEAMAPGIRAAEVGDFSLTVTNPSGISSDSGFEVIIDPARFDINRTTASTTDRLDGQDTVWLSRLVGVCTQPASPNCAVPDATYDPDYDFNGDGWVDGEDLAYLASGLGRCWNGSNWTVAACPDSLR
jgi:hypothetical protein